MTVKAVQQFQLRTVMGTEKKARETLELMKATGKTSSILKSDSMELGYGNMNLAAMVEVAKKHGVEAVVLETHKNWVDKSPIKSFQLSAEFMNEHV